MNFVNVLVFMCFHVVSCVFMHLQKVFNAFYCLRRRTKTRWQYVVQRSHVVIALIYICFGCFGYLANIKEDRSLSNIDYFLEYEGSQTSVIYFNVLRYVRRRQPFAILATRLFS